MQGIDALREWICNGKVVCSTLKQMKQLSGIKGIKEIICQNIKWKNGLIQLGGSQQQVQKKQKYGKIKYLEQIKEQIRKCEREKEELSEDLLNQQYQVNLLTEEKKRQGTGWKQEAERIKSELENVKQSIKKGKKRLEEIIKEKNLIQERKEKIENGIKNIEKDVFKKFCKKVGVKGIDSIRKTGMEIEDKLIKQKIALEKDKDGLQVKIKSNESQMENIEIDIQKCEQKIKNAEQEEEIESENELQEEEVREDVEELRREREKLEEEIQRKQKGLKKLEEQLRDFEEEKGEGQQNKLEKLNKQQIMRKKRMVDEMQLKGILLPMRNEQEKEIDYSSIFEWLEQSRKSKGKKGKNKKNNKKEEDIIIIEEEREDDNEEELSEEQIDKTEKHNIKYNYQLKQLLGLSVKELELQKKKINQLLKEKSEQLDQYVSNFNHQGMTQENYHQIEQCEIRIKDLIKDLDQLHTRLTEYKSNFDNIKKLRRDSFLNIYNKVKNIIDKIYKYLTKTEKMVETGGNAFLYLENNQEPFEGGIIYTATPPTKRYVYDVDQLSGGEKTMAGLALLLAVNIALETPFLVFDETDAFLDANNSLRFFEFVEHCQKEYQKQIIIVTHKQQIFEQSESLVGVTFLKQQNSSAAFSLDLRETCSQLA